PKLKSINLAVDSKEFGKLFSDAGYSKLVDIEIDGKAYKSLIKEVQMNYVTHKHLHGSFYGVDMDTANEAEVPVEIISTAPAVKNNLGFLEVPENTLTVRCLPSNLPATIKVDISGLENVRDAITAADLKPGEGVELRIIEEQGPEAMIAFIAEPQKIEEETE